LHWHEVNNSLKSANYTLFNTKARVESIEDPWKDLTKTKADLKKALQLLKA